MADTIVVFVLTRHWVLGASYDCPRQVHGAWSHHQLGRLDFFAGLTPSSIQLPTCQGTLLFCSRERTRTRHLPVAGGSALELHGWPLSQEAMK